MKRHWTKTVDGHYVTFGKELDVLIKREAYGSRFTFHLHTRAPNPAGPWQRVPLGFHSRLKDAKVQAERFLK